MAASTGRDDEAANAVATAPEAKRRRKSGTRPQLNLRLTADERANMTHQLTAAREGLGLSFAETVFQALSVWRKRLPPAKRREFERAFRVSVRKVSR